MSDEIDSLSDVNVSSLAGPETLKVLENEALDERARMQALIDSGGSLNIRGIPAEALPSFRQRLVEFHQSSLIYRRMYERYDVDVREMTIAGVGVEIFTPKGGVEKNASDRVLINVHGGSFLGGERSMSRLESIPISVLSGTKVISIDYRMAPEYTFPAASDDVLAVYRDLLQTYSHNNIGIYGSSAGAVLTAQSLARFQSEGLPRPAAAAMLGAGAYYWMEGDTGCFGLIGRALNGNADDQLKLENNLYFKGVDFDNAMAFPGKSPEILSKFPPTLLVSSTRDFALSSVVQTHTELIKQDVEAELYVWEGLHHCFYCNPDYPESSHVYDVIIRFFNRSLEAVS